MKPLELILASDDNVVRENAVESLKVVGEKISIPMIQLEYLPLIDKIKQGDLFSQRISATFLFAYIYPRLNAKQRE